MKNINNIKEGDYIAFGFNYNGGEPNEIIVAPITFKNEDSFLVHFLYGYKSLSERIKKEDVLAIGCNKNGHSKIKGWAGKFIFLKDGNELLIKNHV